MQRYTQHPEQECKHCQHPKTPSVLLSVTTPQKGTITQTCIILNNFCLILKYVSGTIHYVLLCVCCLMLNLHLWDWSTLLHLTVILPYCCVAFPCILSIPLLMDIFLFLVFGYYKWCYNEYSCMCLLLHKCTHFCWVYM